MTTFDSQDFSKELRTALEAARQAAEIVMPYYTGGTEVEYKADQTPVTVADREAETVISKLLREAFPDYSILGEESGLDDKSSQHLWVIDPIDGTKNFIRQIPLFGIEIGLLSADRFTVGVSNLPAMNEIAYSDLENGAFCNGKPARVSEINRLEDASVTFSGINILHEKNREQAFLDLVRQVYRVRGFGDAFSFHLVATGRFEAVVQSRVNLWDVAGLVAIIEAAGGRCSDWSGRPFGRGSDSIVASNGKIHDQILEVINR
jgi:histidinol-phosphatase